MRLLAFCVFLLAVLLGLPAQAAVIFDGTFSGDFAPANWTLVLGSASNGSVYAGGAPASVTIDGSNDPANIQPDSRYGNGLTTYRITISVDGDVRFAWQYRTVDLDASYDIAGIVVNGVYTDLSSTSGDPTQNGVAEFSVSAGDTFGFFVDPTDNMGGAASLTISQAPAESPTPEPATFGLVGAALGALVLFQVRRAH